MSSLLQAYAIAQNASTGFIIPKVRILDVIAGNLNRTREEARTLAKNYITNTYLKINRKFKVHQPSDEYLGMYNATTDLDKSVNLSTIQKNVETNGLYSKVVNGYQIKAVKFATRYGRFQKSFEYTEEYGPRVLKSNAPSLSGVEFILKISKGGVTKGASFTIYRTGRVRFSGGYVNGSMNEPNVLLTYMQDYLPSHGPLDVVINNVTSEIKLGVGVDIKGLYNLIDSSGNLIRFRKYDIKVTFEPERNAFITKQRKNSPFLYVSFDKDFTFVISSSGTIAIEGASDVKRAVSVAMDFADSLKKAGLLKPGNKRNVKIAPTASKLARRANMKPAPEITRRGTTCPIGKRPVPYGFQGKCPDGMYVAPNPQGQPCCYKIPLTLSYSKQKVIDAYTRANVKVPDHVRKLFGFGNNTNNKLNNVGRKAPMNLNMQYNKTIGKGGEVVGFKIGSRQCSRYSKVALLDMVKRLGIQNVPSKTTVPILCNLLQRASGNKTRTPVSAINSFKLGQRVCTSYNKKTLVKFAKELGVKTSDSMTRDQLCMAIKRVSKPVGKNNAVLRANRLFNEAVRNATKKKTPVPKKKIPVVNDENFDDLLNFAASLR